jgi:hypothetical protein
MMEAGVVVVSWRESEDWYYRGIRRETLDAEVLHFLFQEVLQVCA